MNKTAKRLYRYRRRLKLMPIDGAPAGFSRFRVIDPKKELGESTLDTNCAISSAYWEHSRNGQYGRLAWTVDSFTPAIITVTAS